MKFFIVNKNSGSTIQKDSAYRVAAFMLGKLIDVFIIIKLENDNARIIELEHGESSHIEKMCNEG